jgi:hypothetical protein
MNDLGGAVFGPVTELVSSNFVQSARCDRLPFGSRARKEDMLKIFAAMLLTVCLFAGTANAHGGGGAEPMPLTNFTDLPCYRPAAALRRGSSVHKASRLHQSSAHNH